MTPQSGRGQDDVTCLKFWDPIYIIIIIIIYFAQANKLNKAQQTYINRISCMSLQLVKL